MGRFSDLAGRTAIVTGGAVGIGGAIASALAENGVSVAVVDSDPAAAEKKAAELRTQSAGSLPVLCDVTQPEQVRQMVAEVLRRSGRIDILVNCTGSMFGGKRTLEVSPEEWDATFALCLRSHYLCTRAVLPHMIERGWGRIVNISSDAGRLPVRLTSPAYAAAKAGVIGFTKHLALEVARQGITVNATVPGTTFTPRTRRTFAAHPERLQEREARNPLGRLAEPEEQAGIVVFLASEEARYITGAVMEVTGGLLMT
ncbi:MAG: SDR family NAD(P)-dependent oxidoreductase [Thermodesulfobacteriota bacterium]